MKERTGRAAAIVGGALGLTLVLLIALPVVGLLLDTSPAAISSGVAHELFWPALGLSVRTSLLSLVVVVLLGTPLAWWMASNRSRLATAARALVYAPVILPPAVLGVALLKMLGRRGPVGQALEEAGLSLAFSDGAVVLTQIIVGAPFFVHTAIRAFEQIDPELIATARTLGASPSSAFFRIALPLSAGSLAGGAALAWARALGEFGATLIFAGNMPGRTQTMPLAIYTVLESDLRLAMVFALGLTTVALAGFAFAWLFRWMWAR